MLRREALPELLLALGIALVGALVLWETRQIHVAPTYARVGPRVLPEIIGAGLVLLGMWLAIDVLRGHLATPEVEEDVDPSTPTDWRTIALISGALVIYLALLERAGYVVASTLLFVLAAFAMGSRRILRDMAAGLGLAVASYLVFTRGLDLRLPPLGG